MTPNLYLNAGQMKAGTTFLYRMLRRHPLIHFSPEKELHFLSQHHGRFRLLSEPVRRRKAMALLAAAQKEGVSLSELQALMRWAADYLEPPIGWEWYERVLAGCGDARYAADFSNLTCTIPLAGLNEIRQRFERVKVTYCVRDPVERAFSHMKFHLRVAGGSTPLAAMDRDAVRALLLSDDIRPQGQTAIHLAHLREAFGEDNLGVIDCTAMWANPELCVEAVCGFLGLPGIEVASADRRPVNVGPAEGPDATILAWIEEFLAEDIAAARAALVEHADLLLLGSSPPTSPPERQIGPKYLSLP